MRRAALPLALLAALPLGACNRTADTFKPRIVITSPDGGGVSRASNFVVRGYALDDQGVTGLTVDGKPVSLQAGGLKIANFEFRSLVQGNRGEYTIRARDAAGNESTLRLPVSVDGTDPALSVTRFERERNVIRVAGVATDNNRVAQVLVDGNRLNIIPGARVEFYAETTGIYADVEVRDAAGNVTTRRVQR